MVYRYQDRSGHFRSLAAIFVVSGDGSAAFVRTGGECVFLRTNKAGYAVGVIVAHVWRDGKFWTTCAERRARVPALRTRPQSAVMNLVHLACIDGTHPDDLTRGEIEGRRQAVHAIDALRRYTPGCSGARLRNFGMIVGTANPARSMPYTT